MAAEEGEELGPIIQSTTTGMVQCLLIGKLNCSSHPLSILVGRIECEYFSSLPHLRTGDLSIKLIL